LPMNQKTSKVEKEFYLRCSYLTLSVLFDKEPKILSSLFKENRQKRPDTQMSGRLFFSIG
ncbi:hypothetical protein, partial [Enterococcus faecium]|uniref:hypothetical protein n=1 Tax=Enterococcus faecium TaxID=1352 RepID=UPI001C4E7D5A